MPTASERLVWGLEPDGFHLPVYDTPLQTRRGHLLGRIICGLMLASSMYAKA